jgi:hypothetical protein
MMKLRRTSETSVKTENLSRKILRVGSVFATLVVAMFVFVACGGSPKKQAQVNEPIVTPKSTALKGSLKDYFEVINKEYKIADNGGWGNLITVELKRNSKKFNFSTNKINPFGTNGGEDFHVGFGIEIYDEAGSPVKINNATEGGMGGPYSSDDVIGLVKLGEGETGFIRWSVNLEENKTYKTFQITSAIEKSNSSSSAKTDDEDEDADWDDVDAAIETSKKAMDAAKDAAKLSKDKDVDKAIETSKKAMDAAKDAAKLLKELQ